MAKIKRPTDINQRAKSIVDIATGETPDPINDLQGKNPHAVALGRLGSIICGKARAAKLSPKKRSEIAKKAAKKRWGKTLRQRNASIEGIL